MELTLTFPDDETAQQFARWWALRGKASCMAFVEGSLDRQDEPYLYEESWTFWWDAIPF